MNPQIRFGEDLMSRVSYVMMNPGGEVEMTKAVRDALNDMVQAVAKEAGCPVESILECTFVGNPIMHHLLLGINPIELGGAPFALATDGPVQIWATEIDLKIHPNARIYVLPCIAGHVGADTAGVILSESPHGIRRDDPDRRCRHQCRDRAGQQASPARGPRRRPVPAFEGAQISCGQRAAPGAIERVRIDRDTLEPRFKVIGCDLWSDHPEFKAKTEGLGVTGVCGSGIIECLAEMYLSGIITQDGVVDGAHGGEVAPAFCRTAAPSPTCCTTASRS